MCRSRVSLTCFISARRAHLEGVQSGSSVGPWGRRRAAAGLNVFVSALKITSAAVSLSTDSLTSRARRESSSRQVYGFIVLHKRLSGHLARARLAHQGAPGRVWRTRAHQGAAYHRCDTSKKRLDDTFGPVPEVLFLTVLHLWKPLGTPV